MGVKIPNKCPADVSKSLVPPPAPPSSIEQKRPFGYVEYNRFFKYSNNVYVKMKTFYDGVGSFNAYNLMTGDVASFESQTLVIPAIGVNFQVEYEKA